MKKSTDKKRARLEREVHRDLAKWRKLSSIERECRNIQSRTEWIRQYADEKKIEKHERADRVLDRIRDELDWLGDDLLEEYSTKKEWDDAKSGSKSLKQVSRR